MAKALNVEWTEAAGHDLEAIAAYIAEDSPFYAAAMVKELRDASRSLATFARRGRIVPEFADPDMRELFVKSYRLIYEVPPRTVTILRIVHGARDLRVLWQAGEAE